MKDLIETLKNNKVAWMFLSKKEQECLIGANSKAGVDNLQPDGRWENLGSPWLDISKGANNIWRINPIYQPEPEPSPVDLEIVQGGDWLGVHRADAEGRVVLPHGFTHLHCLSSMENFEGFYLTHGDKVEVRPEWVARYFPNVIARFKR